MSSTANINQFEHLYKERLFNKLDQKDLEVLQCKNDSIPRGLTPLEELFDLNDVAKKPKMECKKTNVEEHNIGSMNEPKMIKLSSTLPTHIKQEYIALFKEFGDVFAWGYKDLISYDTRIIEHQIPPKEN